MIRTISTEEITRNICEMCIEANHYLSEDMNRALKDAADTEKAPLGKKILHQASGKPYDCRGRDDSDLSGYRDGCGFCRDWSGCTSGRNITGRGN